MRHVATAAEGVKGRTCGPTCPWAPYLAGLGIGVLSWFAFAIVNQPIGISTAVSQASGAAAEVVVGREPVLANSYWTNTSPRWDYGTLFLVGTFLGALASAVVSGRFRIETVPSVWRQRFGPSPLKRFAGAFVGGALTLYGARLAGGCTSGHGISGSLQLALSSWTFLITMFVVGVATALLLFREPRSQYVPIDFEGGAR